MSKRLLPQSHVKQTRLTALFVFYFYRIFTLTNVTCFISAVKCQSANDHKYLMILCFVMMIKT